MWEKDEPPESRDGKRNYGDNVILSITISMEADELHAQVHAFSGEVLEDICLPSSEQIRPTLRDIQEKMESKGSVSSVGTFCVTLLFNS